MEALDRFIAAASARPFAWGADDCCLWLADWAIVLGHPDGANGVRGRYRTALGCTRLLAREGGVLAVVARCAGRLSLVPTASPRRGDVGVIETKTPRGLAPVGAICLGERWAVRADAGLIVTPARPLAAWEV